MNRSLRILKARTDKIKQRCNIENIEKSSIEFEGVNYEDLLQLDKRRNWSGLKSIPILVTYNVKDYREAISRCLTPSDSVLEVGCHCGTTTAVISKLCQKVVGIDKSEYRLSQARERCADASGTLQFHVIDAFDIQAIRKLGEFTVLFVDISGNAKLEKLLPLLNAYERAIKPRLMVVKNHKLADLYKNMMWIEEYCEKSKAGSTT